MKATFSIPNENTKVERDLRARCLISAPGKRDRRSRSTINQASVVFALISA